MRTHTHTHPLKKNRHHTNTGCRLLGGYSLKGAVLFLPCVMVQFLITEGLADSDCPGGLRLQETDPQSSASTFQVPIALPGWFHFCCAASLLTTLTMVSQQNQ